MKPIPLVTLFINNMHLKRPLLVQQSAASVQPMAQKQVVSVSVSVIY